MINDTMYWLPYEATEACFTWCKEQHFVNSANLELEGITIVVVALLSLCIYFLYNYFEDSISFNTYENKQMVKKIINNIPEFAMYMLIGFLIWFVYFT